MRWALALAGLLTAGCWPESDLESSFGNGDCTAPPRPAFDRIELTEAFPGHHFSRPVAMLQAPGDHESYYVVSQDGVVWRTSMDPTDTPQRFLDVSELVDTSETESGLLGFAFAPDYEDTSEVYLFYVSKGLALRFSVVARATVDPQGENGAETVREVLEMSHQLENHFGGHIAFGPDGYLYVGVGDGGGANDFPFRDAQDLSKLAGSMLRLDVVGGRPDSYEIPADNPYADPSLTGVRAEIFASGLRNPWRWSFDRATGDLWLGDVGQDEWEEVNRIEAGGNYGWPECEGSEVRGDDEDCPVDFDAPLVSHTRTEGKSITGGFVYRGTEMPGLEGHYLYGDFITGTIWALGDTGEGSDPRALLQTNKHISAFAEGHDGELFILSYTEGVVYRLRPGPVGIDDFPHRLTETGCFAPSGAAPEAHRALHAYEVNSPLWSDGASKRRWFSVPLGETVALGDDPSTGWEFPPGSVLAKEFRLDGQLIETRLLVRHDDGGWGGYAYEWNDDETEAYFVPASKTIDAGGTSWLIPGPTDCFRCHTEAAGRVLGPKTAQLNRIVDGENQISRWSREGLLADSILSTDHLPQFAAIDDTSASPEHRSRSYLDANCSHCHRPGAREVGKWGTANPIDFRYSGDVGSSMPFCGQELRSLSPLAPLPVVDVVKPGLPSLSMVPRRMRERGEERMPPLATDVHDDRAADLIEGWIDSMDSCPTP